MMKTATYDYCLIIPKIKNATNLMEIIVQQFFQASNLPKNGCPLLQKTYFLHGVKIDGSNVTSLVPSGIYLSVFNMMILENNKKLVFLKISFELNVL